MKEPHVPVSIGELLDKITILQIKTEKISEPEKNKNIRKELTALLSVANDVGIDTNDRLVTDLKKVNLDLWQIEDQIREKEKKKEFDQKFIDLARSVYVSNDRRFEIKSALNEKFSSSFREEKSYQRYQ